MVWTNNEKAGSVFLFSTLAIRRKPNNDCILVTRINCRESLIYLLLFAIHFECCLKTTQKILQEPHHFTVWHVLLLQWIWAMWFNLSQSHTIHCPHAVNTHCNVKFVPIHNWKLYPKMPNLHLFRLHLQKLVSAVVDSKKKEETLYFSSVFF